MGILTFFVLGDRIDDDVLFMTKMSKSNALKNSSQKSVKKRDIRIEKCFCDLRLAGDVKYC